MERPAKEIADPFEKERSALAVFVDEQLAEVRSTSYRISEDALDDWL